MAQAIHSYVCCGVFCCGVLRSGVPYVVYCIVLLYSVVLLGCIEGNGIE